MKFTSRKGMGVGAVLAGVLGAAALGVVGYRAFTGDCLIGGSCGGKAEVAAITTVSLDPTKKTDCPLGCSEHDEAEITTVAMNEKADDCAKACDKPCGAAVTTVAQKTDCAKACATACGDKAKAEIVKASNTTECAKACDKPCGVAVTTVAQKTDCAKACDKPCGAAVTTVAQKTDCAKACDKPCGAAVTTVAQKTDCAKACDKPCGAAVTTVAQKTDCAKACATACGDKAKAEIVKASTGCKGNCSGEMKEGCCGGCPDLDKNKADVVKTSGAADCAKACDKPCGVAVQAVAAKTECAKACDKPCGAAVTTVAQKTDCAKACDKPCGAAVQTVAAKTDCASACSKPCGAAVTTVAAKSECSKSACSTATACSKPATTVFASFKNAKCGVQKASIMRTAFTVVDFGAAQIAAPAKTMSGSKGACGAEKSCDKAEVIKTSVKKSCGGCAAACSTTTASNE
jgi:hypothetical protein